VLLLDEPLSNLDAKLRQEVRVEIRELQRTLGLTTVMVTHDQEEALTMADRLVVMNDGAGTPGRHPAGPVRAPHRPVRCRVRRPLDLHRGPDRAPGRFRSAGGLALVCAAAAAGPATLALRPERILVDTVSQAGMDNNLPGVVEFVSYLGATIDMHVRISPKERVVVQIPNRAGSFVQQVGGQVHVAWPPPTASSFPASGLDRLRAR